MTLIDFNECILSLSGKIVRRIKATDSVINFIRFELNNYFPVHECIIPIFDK